MTSYRITKHPIIEIPEKTPVSFSWNGKTLTGFDGEMISAALFVNGIHIFGHDHKDNSPQGFFCANGRCSQCMVIADGLPVKACMTPLQNKMEVQSVKGLSEIPNDNSVPLTGEIHIQEVAIQSRIVKLPHQDPADRFLAATAIVYDLTLVAADTRIIDAEAVAVLPAI